MVVCFVSLSVKISWFQIWRHWLVVYLTHSSWQMFVFLLQWLSDLKFMGRFVMSNWPIRNDFIYSFIYIHCHPNQSVCVCVWSSFPPIWSKWRTFALITLSLIARIISCAYLLHNIIMNILAIIYSIVLLCFGSCAWAGEVGVSQPHLFDTVNLLSRWSDCWCTVSSSGTLLVCCPLKGALAAWHACCRRRVWIASRALRAMLWETIFLRTISWDRDLGP